MRARKVVKRGDAAGHFVIGLGEEEGAGDEDVGAVIEAEARGGEINAAIHFDVNVEVAAGDFVAEGGDFWEHVVHEGLAAEAGLDRHDEDHVAAIEEGEGGVGGGAGFEDEAGFGAQTTNCVECRRHFLLSVHAGRFEMDGDEAGAGVNELRGVDVGAINHEMDVEREGGTAAEGADDGWADREIRDEVSVHDVHVNIVCAGALGAGDFIAEVREIGGEDRRCNESFHSKGIIAKSGGNVFRPRCRMRSYSCEREGRDVMDLMDEIDAMEERDGGMANRGWRMAISE